MPTREPGLDAATIERCIKACEAEMIPDDASPCFHYNAVVNDCIEALEALRPSAVAGTPRKLVALLAPRGGRKGVVECRACGKVSLETSYLPQEQHTSDCVIVEMIENGWQPLPAAPVAASAPSWEHSVACVTGNIGKYPFDCTCGAQSPAPVSPERGWTATDVELVILALNVGNATMTEQAEAARMLRVAYADLLAAAPAKEREK